eukprot:TRINITY_DN107212_c0_g1_i1.p1 TRINITY_DN107212_c0_g1~~TRINITY_DN107212_c0_g1_i1.p1  ORF type:complete len:159 (+),score=11.29 TRINITY_DN107212_c0_g1_i1:36-479(+)
MLPLTTWSREQHRSYVDAWLNPDEFGGPCALLPLMVHWASLPHRPRLIYDFLEARFPGDLTVELLANGSMEQLRAGYQAAAATGRRAWHAFLSSNQTQDALLSNYRNSIVERILPARPRLTAAACTLGSEHVWTVGGFTKGGRTTQP